MYVWIEVGQSHSLENPNDEELVFMALVYNAQTDIPVRGNQISV